MDSVALPILMPKMPWQHYSCHGCGDCCRDFTVQLRDEDLEKLESQEWESILGESVVVRFRNRPYLRRRDDGACIFLKEDGLCRIHADHGFAAKPIACQVFPFNLAPGERQLRVGVNFLCRSVQEDKGADLSTHRGDLRRFAAEIPELARPSPEAEIARGCGAASEREMRVLLKVLDEWMVRDEVDFATRLDGLAWIAQSLGDARLDDVRDARFEELVNLLGSALPEELELLPIEGATKRQSALFRQAIFARTEDPMIGSGGTRRGRVRTTISQLVRNRRIRRGQGRTPVLSSALPREVAFAAVEGVGPFTESPDASVIDELCLRWIRSSLHGARLWGSAYYGWSVVDGLQTLVLNVACAGWIARLCSAAASRPVVCLEDVRTGIGRVDRHAGRAPWLGSPVERVRLRFLRLDDGLRRLVRSNW